MKTIKQVLGFTVLFGVLMASAPSSALAVAQTATQTLTINVVSQLTVTTVTAPPAVVGQPYSLQLAANGGVPPYTWALQSGSLLPQGLTLGTTGLISGTPTTSGPFTFTVVCKDSE